MCDYTDDNNEDSSDNQKSHNENDDVKNLHKGNIDQVAKQILVSNIPKCSKCSKYKEETNCQLFIK